MQAGTVVTATKGLFQSLNTTHTLTDFFSLMSRSLKGMNLPRLGMAMTMLRIRDGKLRIASAGIPPILIYRDATRQIEEIELAGMPLGYSTRFEYEEQEHELHPGDIVLMITDGLPERLNSQDEELGYPRTYEAFKSLVDGTPGQYAKAYTK